MKIGYIIIIFIVLLIRHEVNFLYTEVTYVSYKYSLAVHPREANLLWDICSPEEMALNNEDITFY